MTLNLVDTTNLPSNVICALQQGNKLLAVKHLCDATGLGLLDAKEAIELAHLDPDAACAASAKLSPAVDKAVSTSFKIIFAWGAVVLLVCVVSFVYQLIHDLG